MQRGCKDISVSLVILTWNRWKSVEQSLSHNIKFAGYPIHEVIHVDNGSEPGFCDKFTEMFHPKVQIRHRENLGVACGYNRGLALSTGSHVVITGCDRVMPKEWLKKWVHAFETVPKLGVLSCYSGIHSERWRGGGEVFDNFGVKLIRSIPVEARMHSKEFLFKVGFWREDFGTYGFEDSEWSDRAERYAETYGLINCTIAGEYAVHLPDTDGKPVNKVPYAEFKRSIHPDPKRKALFDRCHQMGSPHYNPYSRCEPNLLGV